MKKVYEVKMERMRPLSSQRPLEYWRVDVLAHNEGHAALLASAKMRRDCGITNCTWKVIGFRVVAEVPMAMRPSVSWLNRQEMEA